MKKIFTLLFFGVQVAAFAQCPVAATTLNGSSNTAPIAVCVGTTLQFSTIGNVPSGAAIDWYSSPSSSLNPPLTGTLIGSTNATASGCPQVCPRILALLINACNGTGQEQNNEYVVLSSGSGFAVNSFQLDYPNNTAGVTNNDVNIGLNPCGIQAPQASLIAGLQAGSCNPTNIIPAPPGTAVPSGAIVIFFASGNVTATYDFGALCASGQKIYIMQSSCNRASGAFVNQSNCSANDNNRLRKTLLSLSTCPTCIDSLTYSRCGLANQDGEYALKVAGSDTATVANGGILINTANPCNGANFTTLPVPDDTLRFSYIVPNTLCNTTQYIRGVMNPAPAGCVGGFLTPAFAINVQCPTAAISGNAAVCANSSTTLTATGVGTYAWSNAANTSVISVSPTTTTTYTVTVTSTAGCTATATHTVIVNALPTPPIITGSTTWCAGQTNTLGTLLAYSSYLWFNGSSSTTTIANGTGTYSVTVTDANGCATTGSVIVASGLPTPTIIGNTTICAGANATLGTQIAYANYQWSNGNASASISVSPTNTATYTVIVTAANGCTATASQQITVNTATTAITAPTAPVFCLGDVATMTANNGTCVWSNGATTNTISVSPSSSTTYTVTTTNANGCTATASQQILVNTATAAITAATTALCAGNSTTLTANGGTCVWNNGATTHALKCAVQNRGTM